MKILLIEDEDFIRDLYKRQLELAGMPTDAYGLGNDGLNAAHQNPTNYNLVLLDIMLPDTNGLQILKDLKQNNATKPIPVILLTNLSQDMLIKEGFELGAEGYLVKAAYTPAQIVQEVKNILAKKAAPAGATTTPASQTQPLDPSQVQAPATAPGLPPSPPTAPSLATSPQSDPAMNAPATPAIPPANPSQPLTPTSAPPPEPNASPTPPATQPPSEQPKS